MAEEKKLDIVQKYYIRKKDGEIDYEHPYDLIKEADCKGLYYVRLGNSVGYMNADGKFIVPMDYEFTRTTYKGEKNYNHSSGWYYIDSKTAIKEVFRNNGVGVINSHGEEIVPCDFENVETFSSSISEDFIPVALPSKDKSKLVWGMYSLKEKRVSVTPQYDEIKKEWNGYASFKQNGKWGLVHCATGVEVIPAMYLLDFNVLKTGIAIAFYGGSWQQGKGIRYVTPEDCHIWVVNGSEKALRVISGYDWIENSGPSVIKCRIGKKYNPTQLNSFKILKMPTYIAIIRDAEYESGYFNKDTGIFMKEWKIGCCTTTSPLEHARYLSGGKFSAKSYDGEEIPVTDEMKQEILKAIREE